MNTKPEHGWPWLRTAAATKLLDRLLQADREELAITAENDRILVQHVRESLAASGSPEDAT